MADPAYPEEHLPICNNYLNILPWGIEAQSAMEAHGYNQFWAFTALGILKVLPITNVNSLAAALARLTCAANTLG